jgi:hypothetical protein
VSVGFTCTPFYTHSTAHRIKATDATKLQEEYEKLVEGLQEADDARAEDAFMANPSKLLTWYIDCVTEVVFL